MGGAPEEDELRIENKKLKKKIRILRKKLRLVKEQLEAKNDDSFYKCEEELYKCDVVDLVNEDQDDYFYSQINSRKRKKNEVSFKKERKIEYVIDPNTIPIYIDNYILLCSYLGRKDIISLCMTSINMLNVVSPIYESFYPTGKTLVFVFVIRTTPMVKGQEHKKSEFDSEFRKEEDALKYYRHLLEAGIHCYRDRQIRLLDPFCAMN